ncbi:unnamed protein product [Lactuca saligna]|uniref:Uncharacterized protein n=1 Tax=Lactuca saligna TaxID=75948 RepID=A0AA35YFG9_LACSI|nr:unnamed protein product [Lactuca saligna]
MDVNINSGAQLNTKTPEQMKVIPPKISNTKSIMVEVKNPDITVNLSDMDTNVNTDEEPIATLFSSQSTEPENGIHEPKVDDDGVMVSKTKYSLEIHVNELQALMDKDIKKLDESYNLLHKKVDVVENATTCLIEDITAFNKDYSTDLKVKIEKDDKVFEKMEEFMSNFKETLSKVHLRKLVKIQEKLRGKLRLHKFQQ